MRVVIDTNRVPSARLLYDATYSVRTAHATHRYVRLGVLPIDWGGGIEVDSAH